MYIGKIPATGAFQKCDALSASGTADYTLQVGSVNVVPESVNHMIVSLNGVIQAPTTAYTVAGAVLSFASALTSADSIDFVLLLGNVLDIGTPSDNTVAIAKIQDDAVTLAKMAAGTDGNVISYDASGNPVAIATGSDGQVLTSTGAGSPPAFEAVSAIGDLTPSFFVYMGSTQSIPNATQTKLQFTTEDWDSDGQYDPSTNYRWTVATAGKYWVWSTWNSGADLAAGVPQTISIYKNGSAFIIVVNRVDSGGQSVWNGSMLDLDVDDYLEVYVWQNSGSKTTNANRQTHFGAFLLPGV